MVEGVNLARICFLLAVAALVGNGLDARRDAFEGTIVEVDRAGGRLLLTPADGEERVWAEATRGDLRIAREGSSIRGEIFPYREGWRIEAVWPNDPMQNSIIERIGRRLRNDTEIRSPRPFRGIGESIPRFALFRQDGTVFESRSLRGNAAVINFIFTRCLDPNMCPAATKRMVRLQEAVREAGISDVEFVSITLDPEYDTPGIFAEYARSHGVSGDNFHFLTGPVQIVEDLKNQLGVLAEPDENEIIRHTLVTILVDPKGTIVYQVPGSFWSVEDFLARIERAISGDGTY